MTSKLGKFRISYVFIYGSVLAFAFACLLPFLMVIGGSFTNELEIQAHGYQLIPHDVSLRAYHILFVQWRVLLDGYKISTIVTVAGTALSIMICSMLAYPMSLRRLKYRRVISVYAMLTLLFNGGMVPWYIVTVNYLHLKDSIPALIVPYLCNAFNVFLLRNYFQSLPEELYESAKIDGAGEATIFFSIVLRLSTPVLATVSLFIALTYWNDWYLGVMLIDNSKLQPLQLLLRSIVSNIMFLKSSDAAARMLSSSSLIPSEGIKLATCVVTIGPIVFLYPFVQRYFIKGIMIGAVKG
jgi:putative aldouronate transport system permease protein